KININTMIIPAKAILFFLNSFHVSRHGLFVLSVFSSSLSSIFSTGSDIVVRPLHQSYFILGSITLYNKSIIKLIITKKKATINIPDRSEEHTSELQSRFDLVCRLLLEKKKHNNIKIYHNIAYTTTL